MGNRPRVGGKYEVTQISVFLLQLKHEKSVVRYQQKITKISTIILCQSIHILFINPCLEGETGIIFYLCKSNHMSICLKLIFSSHTCTCHSYLIIGMQSQLRVPYGTFEIQTFHKPTYCLQN